MRKTSLALALVAATAVSATAGELIKAPNGRRIEGRYIVVFKDGVAVKAGSKQAGLSVSQVAVDLVTRHRGQASQFYEHALQGFAAQLSEDGVRALLDDPRVAFIEEDQIVEAVATQSPATWGLDRVDQRNLPLNNSYTYNFTGAGVHAYIIDTGVRTSHQEFGGRTGNGFTAINDGNGTNDCNGHGTHVAGTVGGSTYGVAKGVTIHPVRVLGCTGSGSNSGVIAGVDWVRQNHIKPAVANMSLGGGASTALDNALNNAINAGVVFAVAAGNSNNDACGGSPARVPNALTVGSTTSTDARSSFSSFGTCVDLFAPGSSITSAWHTSNTATNTISGTSMATPHVAGVVALYFHQFGNQSPSTVNQAVVNNATTGVVGNPGSGSPNRLLHSLFGGGGGGSTVFSDDFETNKGWTRNAGGSDTATTGLWERGDPQQTASGSSVMQLGTTPSGVNCLVTGASAGSSVGANDIDGGTTSIQSPAINLPSSGTLTLSFASYMAHLNNASSADFLRVSVVNSSGGRTQVFEELGAANTDVASWATTSVNISSFAGQTIRILVEAADAASGSLIEAAVDDVKITQQ